MTEAEWLASDDPTAMLAFLAGKATDRKLRLFACACCRMAWDLLRDDRSREAVREVEVFADALHDDCVRRDAYNSANAAYIDGYNSAGDASTAAACAVVWAAYPAVLGKLCVHFSSALELSRGLDQQAVRRLGAGVIRDLFGDPSRPATFAAAWLTPTAVAVARAIYDGRSFHDLPVLADALQDAGCDETAVFEHCRGPGPHVRGCWVVDLVLGKQ